MSVIQFSLRRSASLLADQQIIYRFPDQDQWHFKKRVKVINKDNWSSWHTYLRRWSDTDADVLISAEHLGRSSQVTEP